MLWAYVQQKWIWKYGLNIWQDDAQTFPIYKKGRISRGKGDDKGHHQHDMQICNDPQYRLNVWYRVRFKADYVIIGWPLGLLGSTVWTRAVMCHYHWLLQIWRRLGMLSKRSLNPSEVMGPPWSSTPPIIRIIGRYCLS